MASGEHEFIRVEDPADPNRCQGSNTDGQCDFIAVPSSQYCAMHGGQHVKHKEKRAELRNYRLDMWHNRVAELGSSKDIKNLSDEVGILRIILEQKLNMCKDSNDLMANFTMITTLTNSIQSMVVACDKLDKSTGSLLGKTAIFQFADELMDIINELIDDEKVVERINVKIMASLRRADERSRDTSSSRN